MEKKYVKQLFTKNGTKKAHWDNRALIPLQFILVFSINAFYSEMIPFLSQIFPQYVQDNSSVLIVKYNKQWNKYNEI